MQKLRIGIIGCGRISVMHFVSAQNLDTAELVACCDIKSERAEKKAKEYGIKAYTDYIEMLDCEKLDAVHLCLPHYIHSKVAMDAMARGINVITEKPMDISYEAALRAVEFGEEQGVLFSVISQCRYNDSAKLVKAAAESGRLGKILTATSNLTWSRSDEYYSESDWKGTWDMEGGGVVIDQAIHSIDLVNWIVDSEIESVNCHMANRGHQKVFVEDTAEGLITYKSGTRYAFYCMNNYGCDEPIEIKLFCENGKVRFGYNHAYIEYNDGSHEEVLPQKEEQVEGGMDYWGVKHMRQINQFYNACLGKESLELSGREALKTHGLIMKLYELGGMRK